MYVSLPQINKLNMFRLIVLVVLTIVLLRIVCHLGGNLNAYGLYPYIKCITSYHKIYEVLSYFAFTFQCVNILNYLFLYFIGFFNCRNAYNFGSTILCSETPDAVG